MYSTLEQLSPAVAPEIFLLDGGLSRSSRVRLRRVLAAVGASDAVQWIPIPSEERLLNLGRPRPGWSPGTTSPYARVLIPELLPRHIRRCVYLDADVLVRRDLSPLFTIGLGTSLVGAVRDFAIGTTVHEWSGVRNRAQPGPYLNSGVLVMDLSGWRDAGLADRVLRYAAASRGLADQDALNGVLESWQELDYEWNVQLMNLFVVERLPHTELTDRLFQQRRDLYRTGAVLHFVGPNPWSSSSTAPGTMVWARALMRSGWYTPREALIWLVPWLCVRTPRHWLWRWRRVMVRAIDSNAGRAARRRLQSALASIHH